MNLELSGCYKVTGDPTEAAMGIMAKKLGLDETAVKQEYTIIDQIPFDSKLSYHAIICAYDKRAIVFVAGSPETMFSWITQVPKGAQIALAEFLRIGLRVVVVAKKQINSIDIYRSVKYQESVLKEIQGSVLNFRYLRYSGYY